MTTANPQEEQRIAHAMERYADGDVRGFEEVHAALAPLVTACLRRWVGNPNQADDLTQETFLRVHRARGRYRRGAPVAPWVLTIARRLSIDLLRSRAADRTSPTSDGRLPEPAPPRATAAEEDPQALIDAVREAVAELPEAQRQVVALHKLEGRPMKEIALALGISEQAARLKAHRGYKRLRQRLAALVGRAEEAGD